MYYHFDYHGGPVSYEWINSTTIAKTWEQMSEAYEAGVRKIWIVNTGDLKPQELPISFFMDLAYDYDKWGASNKNSAEEYLHKWVLEQFSDPYVSAGERAAIEELIDGYTYLNLCRKPEALNAGVYHPFNYGEASYMLRKAADLYQKASGLSEVYEDTPIHDAYEELVGFPVRATANLVYMHLCAGRNASLAKMGCPSANIYAKYTDECFKADEVLRDMYHDLADGKWNNIMLSEHIGFTNWNEEEAQYPLRTYVYPSRKPRMIVRLSEGERWTAGGDWTGKTLYATAFLDPKTDHTGITIENAGAGDLVWKAEADADWIILSQKEGTLSEAPAPGEEKIELDMLREDPMSGIGSVCETVINIDRKKLSEAAAIGETAVATVRVETDFAHVEICVIAINYDEDMLQNAGHFIPVIPKDCIDKTSGRIPEEYIVNELGLTLDADDFDKNNRTSDGGYEVLSPLGKYKSAIKAYPVIDHFDINNAPSVIYNVYAPENGDYDVTLICAPSNPIDGSGRLRIGTALNNGEIKVISMVDEGYMGGENSCPEWCIASVDQEHRKTLTMGLKQGQNTLTVYALDPGTVLERILIRPTGTKWSKGYIGRTDN